MKNFNKNRISLTLGAAMAMYFVCFSFVFASSITPSKVIDLTNKDRMEQKVDTLKENATLDKAALEKATDMFQNNYFAHTSPQGLSPWYWFEKNGYDYIYAGENLAIGFSNPGDEETAWMNSPEHRKNILNANYRETGVAVLEGKMNGEDETIAVQLFGTRAKGGQSLVAGSATQNDNFLPKQLQMEKDTGMFNGPTVSENTLAGPAGGESLVAKAADFVQNFDLEKASLVAAGLMLAICFLINFAAIVLIAVNSISKSVPHEAVKDQSLT